MEETSTLSAELLPPGAMLAERLQIERLIGSGGAACVYLATDIELGHPVAVKMLHKMFAQDRALVQRFLQEAQLLAQINHAHVIKVYDVLVYDGRIFSTLEYCPNGSLADRLFSRRFNRDCIRDLLNAVVSGLDAIHAAGIVHRDLKPSNILFNVDDDLKIADFGVARTSDSMLTMRHQRIGAPQYLAPEVWLGKEITPAVDYYSLGVMLFELAAGRLPFQCSKVEEYMSAHVEEDAPKLRTLWPQCPSWLNDLVETLLDKDPKQRMCSSKAIRVMANPSDTMSLRRVVLDEAIALDPDSEDGDVLPAVESDTRKRRKSYILSLSASDLLSRTRRRARRDRKKSLTLKLPKDAAIIFEVEPPSRDVYYFGIFLISLQVMDGVLTSKGMLKYGTFAEGNPLLRHLMESFSPTQTLFVVKAFAIMAVVLITLIARRSHTVRDMIGVLSCIYIFVAILPWAYLLLLA